MWFQALTLYHYSCVVASRFNTVRECECAGVCENANQEPTASIMHNSSFSLVVNSMFAEDQTPVRFPRCPFKPPGFTKFG